MTQFVPRVRGRSRNDIEAAALNVLRTHSPLTLEGRSSFDIARFCELRLERVTGVRFAVAEDALIDEEGECDGKEIVVPLEVFRGASDGNGRDRFTLAHEAGHAALHAAQLRILNKRDDGAVKLYRRKQELRAFEDPEWQANAFASALLMPRQGVVNCVQRKNLAKAPLFLAARIADVFEVSLQAAEIRVNQLRSEKVI